MVCFWGGQLPHRSWRLLPKVAALVLIVHASAVLSVHTNNKVVYIYLNSLINQSAEAHENPRLLQNYGLSKNINTSNFFFSIKEDIVFFQIVYT